MGFFSGEENANLFDLKNVTGQDLGKNKGFCHRSITLMKATSLNTHGSLDHSHVVN